MGWVEMSERELRRAEVLASLLAGRLTMTAADGLMGIPRRQAHRLARQFTEHGAAGLRHRARGRPSNRGLGPHVRQMAIAYVTENLNSGGIRTDLLRKESGKVTYAEFFAVQPFKSRLRCFRRRALALDATHCERSQWAARPFNGLITSHGHRTHVVPSMAAHNHDATKAASRAAGRSRDASTGDRSRVAADLRTDAHNAAGHSTGCAAPRSRTHQGSLRGSLSGLRMPTGMQIHRQRGPEPRPLSSTCYLPRR
ncbi:helix-turn-helix domain-containing protein [Microvirga yunnanensis]|uniref:helix-turn-helix domain-containing protein n=1 Tax=Microvirga yunnanensis TaxID=2953740 RepID=UPI00358DBD4B